MVADLRAMTRSDLAREQTERLLDRILRVLDKAALKIPPDQLDFRPTPQSMTARQMIHHVYEVLLIFYRGVELGSLAREDLAFLEFDPDTAESPHDLILWGERVKDYVRRSAAELSDECLEAEIAFHFGLTTPGWKALRTAHEEALHHRGQLMVYLRLMGVVPPRINDYS
jgi:uncharacterized damage-inducible protein DinB